MRRLSLILSDLYLPAEIRVEEARNSLPGAPELPMFEWLLRHSDSPRRVSDWRRWLLEQTSPALENHAIASISASDRIDGRELASTWLATPVALEARLDHVRLVDRGLLRLEPAERASCLEEFARVFAPQYLLHDGGERAFFLSGLPSAGVHIGDPARLLGSEIGPALPGRDARELRRLWAEIEMWLHSATFNALRERAGKRRVTALWLWGAVSTPALHGRVVPGRTDVAFYGGDPLICELDRRGGGDARGLPTEWAKIESARSHVVLEFAALTGGPQESLQALDANWFAPAKAALVLGDLQELDILANDLHFRIRARPQLKFWRRRKKWLTWLGAAANPAKA